MLAVVAPLAPVLVDLLIDVMLLLGWIVCLGLLWSWRHTIGAGLRAAAGALDFRILGQSVPLGAPLRVLDDVVTTNLSQWAAATHTALGRFWSATAQLAEWTADEIAGVATDTWTWADHLQSKYLPRYVKYALAGTLAAPFLVRLIAREVAKLIPHAKHVAAAAAARVEVILDRPAIGRLEREIADLRKAVATRTSHAATAATGAVAGALPNVHIFPRLRDLELDGSKLRRRVRRLEKILSAAGAAAIMANALGLPNWRCITRGNLGRTARRICGLGPRALEDLLGLLVDVMILTNICQVLRLMEEGLGVVQPEITAFIGGVDAWLCYGDNAGPPALPALALDLPPARGIALGSV